MAENAIVKSGWLKKSPPPGILKGWKNRFFVLYRGTVEAGEPRLEYYDDPAAVADSAPKGVVLLASCLAIGPGLGPSGKPPEVADDNFCIRVTLPGRILELVAESRVRAGPSGYMGLVFSRPA